MLMASGSSVERVVDSRALAARAVRWDTLAWERVLAMDPAMEVMEAMTVMDPMARKELERTGWQGA